MPAPIKTLPCPACLASVPLPPAPSETLARCPACGKQLVVPPDRGQLTLSGEGTPTISFPPALQGADGGTPPKDTARMVIAIDFGTARSGYAFALVRDRQIHRRTHWPDQPTPYVKTLTNQLCAPDGTVAAWGYSARRELARLVKERAARGYRLLSGFKPRLHTGAPSPEGPIYTTDDGTAYRVVDLIAAYLHQLKEYALQELQGGRSGLLRPEEIRWCLTVPAIWTDSDKRWMRLAAERAGLVTSADDSADRMCLVLEPEAAALYCLDQERLSDPDLSQLQPGTRFMVVDAGGGTVDITVHQVGEGAWLEEVVSGGGGLHGAQFVDAAFRQYLEATFGSEVLRRFRNEEPFAFVKLSEDWEQAKCHYRPGKSITFVPLPVELYRLLLRDYPAILKRLGASQDGDESNLQLDARTMSALFQQALDGVAARAQEHFAKLGSLSCDYLFLVGGFADSPLLQQRIRDEFGARVRKVVVPQEPGAAVVCGAVAYGLEPARIRARRTRLTYGCRTLSAFRPGVDPEEKKVWREHMQRHFCRDRFRAFVKSGDAVDVNREIRHRFSPPRAGQNEVTVVFFASPQREVSYTDEDHVFELGRLKVQLADSTPGLQHQVEASMFFGRTELAVKVRDLTSGRETKATFAFSGTYFPEETGEAHGPSE
ncbi:MAG: HSP70 family protein [Gemmataceae bacterium]|nr:HSP70 family protein [Gemmataceae bacterium]